MKAAIYCRLSEEDKNKQLATDDSASIQNQKALLLQYADEHGWDIYSIYIDDDYTGADRKRPEFNRLLKDAESRKFDIILCKTQSRFTRELELVEKYIHGLFPVWGIRFISIVDNADTANKGNKKSRQINGLVNEWYLEDMSDNIKSVLTNRRQNGFHIGAFALYGYKKDPEKKGHLIIDEEAAAVVREVFALFSRGYGKTAIARILNDRRIPNPTEYKRLCGLRCGQSSKSSGTLWKYSAIADMLANEMYIGNMVQGRYGSISYKTKQNRPRPKEDWYIVENTHEPIIDRDLWDRVQALLSERSKPFISGTIGLFSKKAFCAGCGYAMRSSKSRGKHYLQCPTRHIAKSACDGSFISVQTLESIVLNELNRLCGIYLDTDVLAQSIDFSGNLKIQKEKLLSRLNLYDKKLSEYSKAMRDIYMDKVRGIIGESDFTDMSKSFAAEKQHLECTVSNLKNQLSDLEEKISAVKNSEFPIEKYTKLDCLNREIVEFLIDSIVVHKRIPGTRIVPIDIHWNF